MPLKFISVAHGEGGGALRDRDTGRESKGRCEEEREGWGVCVGTGWVGVGVRSIKFKQDAIATGGKRDYKEILPKSNIP